MAIGKALALDVLQFIQSDKAKHNNCRENIERSGPILPHTPKYPLLSTRRSCTTLQWQNLHYYPSWTSYGISSRVGGWNGIPRRASQRLKYVPVGKWNDLLHQQGVHQIRNNWLRFVHSEVFSQLCEMPCHLNIMHSSLIHSEWTDGQSSIYFLLFQRNKILELFVWLHERFFPTVARESSQ